MPLSARYEDDLRDHLAYYEDKDRSAYARKSAGSLLLMVLFDALLDEPLDTWRALFKEQERSSPPTHSKLVVPGVHLEVACTAWLLGESADEHLDAAWSSVERAWNAARDQMSKRVVSSAALAISVARKDREAAEHWLKHRKSIMSGHGITDVELLHAATAMVTGSPFLLPPDLAATVASHEIFEGVAMAECITALAVGLQATSGSTLASILAEGRRAADDNLWPNGSDEAPKADSEPLEWSITKSAEGSVLRARLVIAGGDGALQTPAPLLTPILSIVKPLEGLLTGELKANTVKGARSKAHLASVFANPDVPLQLHIEVTGDTAVKQNTLEPYRSRLYTAINWLQHRHDSFSGPVELRLL